jgi:hypothetical protein
MKPEDRSLLESGKFDRDAWAALWDRLPERMRKKTAEFVLHKLHAVESGGQFSTRFSYQRGSEPPDPRSRIYQDKPGDVVTCEARFEFGYGENRRYPQLDKPLPPRPES